jgi:predicted methyltransferase
MTGLREVHRVLRKGGRLQLMHVWLSSTRYRLLGRLPGLIREKGFSDVKLSKKGFFLEYHLAAK